MSVGRALLAARFRAAVRCSTGCKPLKLSLFMSYQSCVIPHPLSLALGSQKPPGHHAAWNNHTRVCGPGLAIRAGGSDGLDNVRLRQYINLQTAPDLLHLLGRGLPMKQHFFFAQAVAGLLAKLQGCCPLSGAHQLKTSKLA